MRSPMPQKRAKPPEPGKSFSDELSLRDIGKKKVSPLNAPVWRLTLLVSAGCALSWFIRILLGFKNPFVIWSVVLLASASWVLAIRMLLLDAKLKKFWIIWLSIGFLILIFFHGTSAIWTAAAFFSLIFLLFRRYRPFRHLTSRRRAAIFLIGFIVFILLTMGFFPSKIETSSQPAPEDSPQSQQPLTTTPKPSSSMSLGHNLARYSLGSLRIFWFFTLLHLFFAIRLHFMKLRPKLAVSAFLIAVVPLLLVLIMGVVTLYSTLGESRASRAGTILQDWANLAAKDKSFIQSISDNYFTYEKKGSRVRTEKEIPAWLEEFLSALEKDESMRKEWTSSEEAKYLWIGSEIWLVNIRSAGRQDLDVTGGQMDRTMMDRLAKILHADVKLSFSNPIRFTVAGDVSIRTVKSEAQPSSQIYGKFLSEDKDQTVPVKSRISFWSRPLYFGMTHLDVISFDTGKLENQKILLLTEASFSSIANELLSERNPLSQVVMIALLSLAILLFILETFVFFFGVRITTGITSAVRALHRGTRRIAEGDLDTQIVMPNEDELGDLAASFNVMATAVKKGREEALARQRMESELETARKIQEKLLPDEMPRVPGFEIAGTSIPSQQVGGDYFDFLDMGNQQLGIAIADVSGKGIPAALLMANLQASLHAQVIKPTKVAEVTSRLNNLLVRSTEANMFATFFYAILDRKESKFTSTNAGHNPPLLFRKEGNIERLETGGLLLGFLPDQEYKQQTVTIMPGDVVVLYTDGITEAAGVSAEKISENLFGEKRLIGVVQANMARSARGIQSFILKAITEYTAGAPQFDDITLVVIKRK